VQVLKLVVGPQIVGVHSSLGPHTDTYTNAHTHTHTHTSTNELVNFSIGSISFVNAHKLRTFELFFFIIKITLQSD